MALDKMAFTIGELITIGSIIVGVTTSYSLLKGDVKIIQKDIEGIHAKLEENQRKMDENQKKMDDNQLKMELIQSEQFRMNALLNFVYGEGVRAGWKMSKKYGDGVLHDLQDKPWLTEQEKKKTR